MEANEKSTGKERHGCLTAWLIFMIIANSGTALTYLLGSQAMKQMYPDAPQWTFVIMAVCAIFNLVCAISLFRWKRWGFWGFAVTSVIALFINFVIGLGIGASLSGLLGIVILYGVLHIGKENKGWPQLD